MKKGYIAIIVINIIIIALLTSILVLGILGKGGNFSLFSRYHYKNASQYEALKDEMTFNEQISSIDVDWVSGNVIFKENDGEEVKISETYSEEYVTEDKYHAHYYFNNHHLSIKFFADNTSLRRSNRYQKELVVSFPAKYLSTLNVNTVSSTIQYEGKNEQTSIDFDGETVSGNITLENVQFPKCSIESVSGGIKLNNSHISNCQLNTVSGSIHAYKNIFSKCEMESVSGKINASGEFTNLNLESVSGDINIDLSNSPFEVNGETVSGDFIITILKDCGFNAKIDTVSGNVNCDFATKLSKKTITYNDGGIEFDLSSVSGDFTFKLAQ